MTVSEDQLDILITLKI